MCCGGCNERELSQCLSCQTEVQTLYVANTHPHPSPRGLVHHLLVGGHPRGARGDPSGCGQPWLVLLLLLYQHRRCSHAGRVLGLLVEAARARGPQWDLGGPPRNIGVGLGWSGCAVQTN